jgi:hypothetical protein
MEKHIFPYEMLVKLVVNMVCAEMLHSTHGTEHLLDRSLLLWRVVEVKCFTNHGGSERLAMSLGEAEADDWRVVAGLGQKKNNRKKNKQETKKILKKRTRQLVSVIKLK